MKRSSLEPKLLQNVFSAGPIDWRQIRWPMVNVGLLFLEKTFPQWYIAHFCRSATKFGRVRGLANQNLFPNFANIGRWVPWYHAATCISPSLIHL